MVSVAIDASVTAMTAFCCHNIGDVAHRLEPGELSAGQDASPEQPLQEPAAGLAVEPEAVAVFVFHAEVVARLVGVAAPPFAGKAFGAFGAPDPVQAAVPAEV